MLNFLRPLRWLLHRFSFQDSVQGQIVLLERFIPSIETKAEQGVGHGTTSRALRLECPAPHHVQHLGKLAKRLCRCIPGVCEQAVISRLHVVTEMAPHLWIGPHTSHPSKHGHLAAV
jgi:hypothetical protein